MLRHKPDSIGIQLDEQGWTEIAILIEKIDITFSELEYVVANNAKQRFAISADKLMIRANQGHSINIDLNLVASQPPDLLFHGTSTKNKSNIDREGLKKMNRNHVHLSPNVKTAAEVGQRHGKPVVYVINAESMAADGHSFYQAENGVWLTDNVPIKFLRDTIMDNFNSEVNLTMHYKDQK